MPPNERSDSSQGQNTAAASLGALEVLAATASTAASAPVPSQADTNNEFFGRRSTGDAGRDKKKKKKKHSRSDKEKHGKRRKEKKMSWEKGVAMVSVRSEKEVTGGGDKLSLVSNEANKSNSDEQKEDSSTELRKGKWTAEEEEYTTRVIHYFSSGLITLPGGKTLRSFLAEKLQCDPMRITKKYAGAACLGKRIHNLCESPQFTPQEIDTAKREIEMLEERFRMRLALGDGATLPPLQPAPVIRGNTLSMEATYQDSTSHSEVPNYDNSQKQTESLAHFANAPAMNGNTTYPNLQSHGTASSNNIVDEILRGLTSQPQFPASSNNPDYSSLLNALSQSTMDTSKPQYMNMSAPPAQAPLNVALQQLLQQAGMHGLLPPAPAVSHGYQPQVQTQEAQASSLASTDLQQLLLSFNSNVPAPSLPNASNPNTIDHTTANKNLTQTLLSQVKTQLKMLSAISPTKFQAVQSLLVPATTMPSNPTSFSQVAPELNFNDPSVLSNTIQQLANPQASSELAQQISQVVSQQSLQQPAMNQSNKLQDVFAQQQQLSSFQGLLQNIPSQMEQQKPRTQSAASRNLQSLIAAQQAASANASNNGLLAKSYNEFMSNLAEASKNASMMNSMRSTQTTNPSPQQNTAQVASPQSIQQSEASGSNALSQMISNLVRDNPSLLGTNTDINALIGALRNGNTQAMSVSNGMSSHQGTHDVLELPVPNHLNTAHQEGGTVSYPTTFADSQHVTNSKNGAETGRRTFGDTERSTSSYSNGHAVYGIEDSGPLKKRLKMQPSNGAHGIVSKNFADLR
jgi:hypothetical protein